MKKKSASICINLFLVWIILGLTPLTALAGDKCSIQIEISIDPEFKGKIPSDGRMIIIFGGKDSREPRFSVGWPGKIPFFGVDISGWNTSEPLLVSDKDGLIGYYRSKLNEMDPGQYRFQILYDVDTTFSYINAHGNFYSSPVDLEIEEGETILVKTILDQQVEERIPESTEFAKFVKIESELLSEFWGKPIFLRAGVLLPAGFYDNPEKSYPVRYNVGGYHSRFTRLERRARQGSDFMQWWLSEEAPQMIIVFLDGEAPYGDSYQMNSENNGPYADATMNELIPHIEKKFRGVGKAEARFLDGGSTGGWVVLALQIFYPEFFNGAWSTCSDAVDFHYFQLVNIYDDDFAFINSYGNERPGMRTTTGEPVFSMRQEVQMENVLGRRNSFVFSGGQWGGWNAVYSPTTSEGPAAIWDPENSYIDHETAEYWKKWDLKEYLEKNWKEIGPKIHGKIKIWMGDMDSFFLNNAMRLMEEFLENTSDPESDAFLSFEPGKGHCGHRISEKEMMEQMMNRYMESTAK